MPSIRFCQCHWVQPVTEALPLIYMLQSQTLAHDCKKLGVVYIKNKNNIQLKSEVCSIQRITFIPYISRMPRGKNCFFLSQTTSALCIESYVSHHAKHQDNTGTIKGRVIVQTKHSSMVTINMPTSGPLSTFFIMLLLDKGRDICLGNKSSCLHFLLFVLCCGLQPQCVLIFCWR